ncbi:type III secretion system translocon subunit SctE [Vibrio aquimaris]|uniref:Secretion system effector C (SseC) like family protein n=1 Tax=Vibrio aquimaris TaxID=2587862 RepID=A0A5P9CP36_9VIBR|nr:type III secretion system translocon subunit SctE [Vibrio aquimaris]QFT27731.1 Secretion system effector C (SseC) like family protein [Vibrio aquimaris]
MEITGMLSSIIKNSLDNVQTEASNVNNVPNKSLSHDIPVTVSESHVQESGSNAPVLEEPAGQQTDIYAALMLARAAMQDSQVKFSQTDVKAAREQNKAAHEDRIAQQEKAIEKMEKAKKGGLFKKIFGWIATVAVAIAAIATTVATFGAAAPAGAAAIAGAVGAMVGAGLMVGQQVAAEFGVSLTEKIAVGLTKAFGLSEKVAQLIADIGFGIAVTALTLGGAAAASATKAATNTISSVANTVNKVSQGIAGAGAVGQGSSQIATSTLSHQAAKAQADAKETLAEIAKNQAQMEEMEEAIKDALSKRGEIMDLVIAAMKENTNSQNGIIRHGLTA